MLQRINSLRIRKRQPIDDNSNVPNSNGATKALHRWNSLRLGKTTERPRVRVRAQSSQALPEADAAYDAKHYFADDVIDPWCEEGRYFARVQTSWP